MSQEFKLPELGENIEKAGVVSVLVKEGDTIQVDTPILEIETDKATIEVPSNVAGKVSKVHVKAGEKASVGQVVLTLDETADNPKEQPKAEAPKTEAPKEEPKAAPKAPEKATSSGAVEVKLPFLGDGIKSAKVLNILVKAGETVTEDTGLIELETDKATVEVPGGQAGTVKEIKIQAGDTVEVDQVIAILEGTAKETKVVEEKRATAPVATAPNLSNPKGGNGASAGANRSNGSSSPRAHSSSAGPGKAAAASPTVRRLAREIGVDINTVHGSGPKGRISHEDVKAHARALLKKQPQGQAARTGAPYIPVVELPDFSKFGQIEREAISGIRKKTAQQMALAWTTIPMVTQFDKADITELEKLRQKLDVKAKKEGNKLTVTAILLRIVASGLKKFPKFNASLDLAKEEVVFKKYFNVGVAVDTERGLLVPVVKDVDKKNVFQLSADLGAIAEKARNRKVTPDDLQGSCFTITNLGGIGGTGFTPIVNPPEVGILGVSRSSMEPVWQDGAFVPRNILPLSLSYDHRLVDGADAARFLRFVCEALENPALLIFEG